MDGRLLSSGFYVMVTGQVDGCKLLGHDNLYMKYSFNKGHDWVVVSGVEHGISQIARRSFGGNGATGSAWNGATSAEPIFVWNYPIDCIFRSTNVYGWPQIVMAVYTISRVGANDCVRGYGCVHIPTIPGRHVRYVRLYTPMSSSLCQRLTSWLTNNPPEFFDSKFIAQGKGREVTRVRSNGVIKVTLNITTKNMSSLGYSIGGERATYADTIMYKHHPQVESQESDPQVSNTIRNRGTAKNRKKNANNRDVEELKEEEDDDDAKGDSEVVKDKSNSNANANMTNSGKGSGFGSSLLSLGRKLWGNSRSSGSQPGGGGGGGGGAAADADNSKISSASPAFAAGGGDSKKSSEAAGNQEQQPLAPSAQSGVSDAPNVNAEADSSNLVSPISAAALPTKPPKHVKIEVETEMTSTNTSKNHPENTPVEPVSAGSDSGGVVSALSSSSSSDPSFSLAPAPARTDPLTALLERQKSKTKNKGTTKNLFSL